MLIRSYQQAKKQAHANADYFGVPFYVKSTTTVHMWDVSRERPLYIEDISFTAYPKIYDDSKVKMLWDGPS